MPGFAEITTTQREDDGLYVGSLDESWLQGPGAIGGVTAGAMIDAMTRQLGDPSRPLRSVSAELSSPLRPAPYAIEARALRRGGSVTSIFAETTQDSGTVAAAIATFGETRDDPDDFDQVGAPDVPEPEELDAVQAGMMPAFTQHFEYRFCLGAGFFAGAERAHLGGWLRPRVPTPLDARLAVALLDAYPPAIFTRFQTMRPVSTVQMSAALVRDYDRDANYAPDAHYLVEKRCDVSADGYCEERQFVWGPDRRLVARGRQLMVII